MNNTTILEFIQQDLAKSGLSIDSFSVTPLMSETELMDRLGFKFIGDRRITEIGGYWIKNNGHWRLKLMEKIGDIKYLSPKGAGNHAYILPQVREIAKNYSPDKPIFFTEGEKKAAKLTLEGFPCIGLTGVWNFKDSENDFLAELTELNLTNRKCYICFDSDITDKFNVRHAELRLAIAIINHGGIPLSVRLPNEESGEKNGADDYLVRYGKEKLQKLLDNAKPASELHIEEGLPTETIIKEIAKIDSDIERERILKAISTHFKIPIEAIRKELAKHMPKTDKENASDSKAETFTAEEIQAAEQLLKSPDILLRMRNLTERVGYVGEDINKDMVFLSGTSRLLDEAICLLPKGGPSSGKSTLVNMVLRTMPKEAVHAYTAISGKALIYSQSDLSHSILFIQEHHGAEAADYSIRTGISEGSLSILVTVKDEKTDERKSIEKKIEAKGLAYIETTTRERIHNENQTRMFDLFMDESKEMNEKVVKEQGDRAEDPRDLEALEGEFRVWRCAQTLLKPYRIRIPFAKKISDVFPTDKTRVRRDHIRFQALIQAHALLYQYQRETDSKGFLVATLDDFKAVVPLAEKVLAQSLKELTPKQELVLELIQHAFKAEQQFSMKELFEAIVDYDIVTNSDKSNLSLSEFNSYRELLKKRPDYDIMTRNIRTKEKKRHRTIQRYIRGFVDDGLLEWNEEKGAASRYWFSYSGVAMSQYTIFSRKFLESLENDNDKQESHDLSLCHNLISDGEDKGADITVIPRKPGWSLEPWQKFDGADKESGAAQEGNGSPHSEDCDCLKCCPNPEEKVDVKATKGSDNHVFTKTVAIDRQLIRLEYDKKAGTIIMQKDGKTHLAFEHEPEFQEYLRYFEGGQQ